MEEISFGMAGAMTAQMISTVSLKRKGIREMEIFDLINLV
jgi:hypothetical protein